MPANFVKDLLAALTFAVMGIVIFSAFFAILDWLTPYDLWKEINEEKNLALGVLVGSMCLGICIIIASAIK